MSTPLRDNLPLSQHHKQVLIKYNKHFYSEGKGSYIIKIKLCYEDKYMNYTTIYKILMYIPYMNKPMARTSVM